MPLDPLTLWAVVLFIGFVICVVMLLAWWLTPTEVSLGYWAAAVFLLAAGLSLGYARTHLPETLSILFGNMGLLAGYGLLWAGVRRFDGRRPRLPLALFPAALWPLVVALPPFSQSVAARFAVVGVITCVLLALTTYQLWRSREGVLRARRTVMVLFAAMAMLTLARVPLAGRVEIDGHLAIFTSPAFVGFAATSLSCLVIGSFALIIMVRERAEMRYRSASLVDELTGLLNRRGFIQEALRGFPSQGAVAVLMLDLDGFKQVNDRLGHAEGDRVLAIFAKVLKENFRHVDIAGRIGGEEFAALLPGQDLAEAGRAAERIRRTFERVVSEQGFGPERNLPLPLSVSIGVSATDRPPPLVTASIEAVVRAMMAQADRELYRAKSNGRNRVELAVFDPGRINSVA
ncbi:GGDEF domain-containing protein [Ancylobacter lacus]|uniref:GGDEF domain-containing protein n=1 Tax=Ancylobacter lacus TaxID=2579970 RepID=UPI001BCC58AE|nr:GGDEF domain-containing protein [Ancylobacter lacus]MBS7538503.1 GGDEF domain-containing protein [Ancylobacter lacus]